MITASIPNQTARPTQTLGAAAVRSLRADTDRSTHLSDARMPAVEAIRTWQVRRDNARHTGQALAGVDDLLAALAAIPDTVAVRQDSYRRTDGRILVVFRRASGTRPLGYVLAGIPTPT